VYTINDDLLTATGNHPMIIKRDGSWITDKKMNELVVGDKLYTIDDTEVEVQNIQFNGDTRNEVVRLEIDYNYFVNSILVKGGSNG